MNTAVLQPGAWLPPAAPPRPWPALREELTLHPGPQGPDGGPSWTLQDPVRHQFFRIDWLSFEILSRWHLADAQRIADAIERDTPLAVDATDVEAALAFVVDSQLVQCPDSRGLAAQHARAEARHAGAATWLLHHYLFFRVPLWRPDRALARWAPLAAPLYTRGFLAATLLAALLGLWMVQRQWAQFSGTLVDLLTPRGLAMYGLTLVAVKVLHEFGHAITAKRLGCRVPTMGVAFLVMWPVAYTDVTDAWRLPQRRQRLAVGAAGIATELALAAWCTLAWALLPDGAARNLCFVVATTTWVTTLLINASPIMRFDGYFLLSDLLNLPNLHARAFALGRWRLREALFGLGEEPPEHFAPWKQRALVLFAYAVWASRLLLFLGIAAMVYHCFFKALGVFLFAVEIAWFVAMPVWSELRAWQPRWARIRRQRRSAVTLGLAALALVAVLVPWHTRVAGQGVLRPHHYPLHAAGAGRLQELGIAHGQAVQRDQALFALESPELRLRERMALLRLQTSQAQLAQSGFDDALRARQAVMQEERRGLQAELAAVRDELARHAPHAPFSGLVVDVPPDLQPGTWVARGERLGTLVDPQRLHAEAYLADSEVERIRVGDSGHFYPETAGRAEVLLRVVGIDRDATRVLSEPQLALGHGGEIAVREKRGQLLPEQALYKVTLEAALPEPASAGPMPTLRGRVVIDGQPRSLLGDSLRSAAAVLVRESGW